MNQEEASRLRRMVALPLHALRSSIERVPSIRMSEEISQSEWMSFVLQVEEIRVKFNAARAPFVRRSARAPEDPFLELQDNLSSLSARLNGSPVVRDLPYRLIAGDRMSREIPPILLDRALTVGNAVETLIDVIQSNLGYSPSEVASNSLFRLRQIVPDQKIAPVQFGIVNSQIVVIDQRATFDPEDKENIDFSREALLSRGEKLIEELSRSNCDRRLLESVQELQAGLAEPKNIIQLGLLNIGCEAMCGAFEQELPDALRGMLHGQTTGIGMFVGQFPEWQRFTEKAAGVQLEPSDIERIASTADLLVSELKLHPELADPKVPATIQALRELIADPEKASKRAAFAVLRTIENLVSKVFQYTGELLESTAKKTIDGLASVASKTIIVGLMGLALSGAAGLSPVASKIGDTAWMKTAAEIVRKQIESYAGG